MSSSTSAQQRQHEKRLAEARQAGTVAPAVDAATGQMINPHNPAFLTKKPWYLTEGGAEAAAPTLDHQSALGGAAPEASLQAAEEALRQQRWQQKQQAASGSFVVGQWVEALKKNKLPYRMARVTLVDTKRGLVDLEYEDGSVEKKVKARASSSARPRLKPTRLGNRSAAAAAGESYDSKRDAYHGYDQATHNQKLAQKYSERDALRKKLREQEQAKEEKNSELKNDDEEAEKKASDEGSDFDDSDVDSDNDDSDSDEEFKERDEDAKVHTTRLARQGGVGGAQMKVTARNLRIREDTAKYLRNLDIDSAYYDPKSRSMRDNPHPHKRPDEVAYAGDNFARVSGDAVQLAQTQLFAWEATEKSGVDLHPQANPSQAELLKKKFQDKKKNVVVEQQKAILDKYGGQEYLDGSSGLAVAAKEEKDDSGDKNENKKKVASTTIDRKLRFGVSTQAERYNADGRLVTDANKQPSKRQAIPSKYEEDIFINGHSTVWGSYFHKGAYQWGYADDHSLMKSSYCTGENGRLANDEANEMKFGTGKAGSAALAQARGMLQAMSGSDKSSSLGGASMLQRSKLYGEAEQNPELDASKVKEALKKSKTSMEKDDRKRKYHSMEAGEVDISQEDMEAYRLTKEQKSDPMANIGSEELLKYKS